MIFYKWNTYISFILYYIIKYNISLLRKINENCQYKKHMGYIISDYIIKKFDFRTSTTQTITIVAWPLLNIEVYVTQMPDYFSVSTKQTEMKHCLFSCPNTKLCNTESSIKIRSIIFTLREYEQTNRQTKIPKTNFFYMDDCFILFYSEETVFYRFIICIHYICY